MVLTALALGLTGLQQSSQFGAPWEFADLEKTYNRFQVISTVGPLSQPRICPRHEWGFDYLSIGYAGLAPEPQQWQLRFRVYSQERRAKADLSPLVTRFLLRLWEYNFENLKQDHSLSHRELIDVYLSSNGKAGGEQMFTTDPFEVTSGIAPRANVIFIYQLPTFTDSLEMARELAHEYGHATLPPVGPYTAPEKWANGFLGERLYLNWMLKALKTEQLSSLDAMLAKPEQLQDYVNQKVKPLVAKGSVMAPNDPLLKKRDATGMDAYMAQVLFASEVLPGPVFSKVLILSGQTPEDFGRTLVEQVKLRPGLAFNVSSYKGKAIWLPTGGLVLSSGSVQKKVSGWSLVKVPETATTITVK